MNKKIKKLWVKALRSGDYTQGTGSLRDSENNFCCLGVLCNLHAKASPQIAAEQEDETLYLGEGGLLPFVVAEWADFKLSELILDATGGYDGAPVCNVRLAGRDADLASLNDGGLSFDNIANLIEANL
jgi:hypothetical protein